MTNLDKLKQMYEGVDETALSALLDKAETFILLETGREKLTPILERLQLEVAKEWLEGAESKGIASRNEGGITVVYRNTDRAVSDNLKATIKRYRLGKVGGRVFEQQSAEAVQGP